MKRTALLAGSLLALTLLAGSGGAAEPSEHISEIKAEFRPDERATHYTVEVTGFPVTTGVITPDSVKVRWTLELTCIDAGCPDSSGTDTSPKPNVDPGCNNNHEGVDEPDESILGPEPPEFVWHHPSASQDPTGTYHCDHAREGPHGHQGLITVVVTDGKYSCTATYKGSNSSTSTSVQDGTASAPDCHAVVTPECLRGVEITKRVIDGLEWNKYKHVTVGSSNDAVTTLGPSEIAVGKHELFRVLITVKNGGSCTLNDVEVRDEMPLGWQQFDNDVGIINNRVSVVPGPGGDPKHPTLPEIHGLSDGHEQVGYTFPKLGPGQEGTIIVGGDITAGGDFVNQARVVAPAELQSNKVTLHVTPNPYISKITPKKDEVDGDANDGENGKRHTTATTPPLWRLKRVEVAIRALSGSAGRRYCRWLRAAGGGWSNQPKRFGVCGEPIWLKARGTGHWLLKLHGLPSGRYLAQARAINAARIAGRRGQRSFSVR